MKSNMNKAIIFAAHPDDEILGCGGTMAKMAKEGVEVHVVFFADGESSRGSPNNLIDLIKTRKNNAIKACELVGCSSVDFLGMPDNRLDSLDLLEIVKKVEHFIELHKPHQVFTHYDDDLNIDHQIVNKAVITACRPQPGQSVKELYFFEIPSSTEWGLKNLFNPNCFFDISNTLHLKLDAMSEYKNELKEYPHPRSIKSIEALTLLRGSSVGLKAAEAFILARKIV